MFATPYIATNGTYFLNAHYKSVADVNNALVFTEKKKASNFIKTLPKSIKNLRFRVEEMELKTECHSNVPDKIIPLDPAELETLINSFTYFAQQIQSSEKHFRLMLHTAEQEITDIQHAAEFYTYNASQGFKLYKMLHDSRCKRRQAKDSLRFIEAIKKATFENWSSGTLVNLVQQTKNRKYDPRILSELFTATED